MGLFTEQPFARLTNELVAPPPLYFENSLYFNFIIKANMGKLQKICNEWFNIPSNFEKVFEPVMPYVMVTFAYYPRAYSESWKTDDKGFMPYKELIFVMFVKEKRPFGLMETIGLQKPNFYGFVPFLFLDNAVPVAAGREIFGMPKVMADLDYPGLQDKGPGQKFSASSLGFPKSHSRATMARKQLIMEVTCPDDFDMRKIMDQASGNPHDAIAREFYRTAETDSINLNLSSQMIKVHEMAYLSMRQYRDVQDTERAVKKSIIEFPGQNITVTGGGMLPGPFEIRFGKNSATYPVQEAMGLENRATMSYWFQWDFRLTNGKNIWEWKR